MRALPRGLSKWEAIPKGNVSALSGVFATDPRERHESGVERGKAGVLFQIRAAVP